MMGKKDRLIEGCMEGQTKFFLPVNVIVIFLPIYKLTGLENFEKVLPMELHADFLPSAVQVSSLYFLHSSVKY